MKRCGQSCSKLAARGGAAESGSRAASRSKWVAILAEKLGRYEDALEAYQRALKDAPDDADTVAAVEEIRDRHDDLKVQVAEILVPVLRDTNATTSGQGAGDAPRGRK